MAAVTSVAPGTGAQPAPDPNADKNKNKKPEGMTEKEYAELKELRRQGPERMKQFIVRGIIDEDFVATFFSTVRKVPCDMPNPAAVCMTENGISLIYDRAAFAKMDRDQIAFTLEHELVHVLNMHFLRGDELMAEFAIGVRDFYKRFAPFADLPTNYTLRDTKGYKKDMEHLLTYEKAGVSYDKHPTFEAVVKFLLSNPKKHGNMLDKMGLGSAPTVLIVDENGNLRDLDGNPVDPNDLGNIPVIVMPDIHKEAKSENMKDIADMVQTAEKTAGRTPHHLEDLVNKFKDAYDDMMLSGWRLLEQFLVGQRSINKAKNISMKRLNRRTRMLPGKIRKKGFRTLFIVDESGSMNDEEVDMAFSYVKHVCLRDNMDRVYVLHWDTEPAGPAEEIQNVDEVFELQRKKCGGTEFEDLFSHEYTRTLDVDLIVVVTDGYPCGWPNTRPPVPHLWIVTQEGGYQSYLNDYGQGIGVCVEEK